jgi:DnaJ-class molecular chaperone
MDHYQSTHALGSAMLPFREVWILCPTCSGSGGFLKKSCPRCMGACFLQFKAKVATDVESFSSPEGKVVLCFQKQVGDGWVQIARDEYEALFDKEAFQVREIYVFEKILSSKTPLKTLH